ncbi:BON domain-containing protein [Planctellipticum variicoloris]|uniref:BON domain-containing protein n=1 Tax=Planctellipticum variicoloris TaxID=3064265 RepID=UPI003013A8B6|nr:BON domain-containing protein [Planctomycetaceae bacterium SH412]
MNVRDRDSSAKTSFDQNENQADINVTANIRKRLVDTKMSVNAQNVKIVTQNGKVTLRGPVETDDEKQRIEELATAVAGRGNVENQLEVNNP